ncbi:carbon-nitrogen hydrolase family protein [Isosphaeraceae bacterium EP7]
MNPALMMIVAWATLVGAVGAAEPARRVSKAEGLPRKVIVGTAIFRSSGPAGDAGQEKRMAALVDLVDTMARKAEQSYPGRGLDLVILPETAATASGGPASTRSIRLVGPVREAFGALARKYSTYLVATMDLVEDTPAGTTYSNSAVLFDRKGEVAGIYRKVHPVAWVGVDNLEGGITPGREFPVFECDFGKLGIQICWDMVYEDGWKALAEKGAEIVVWPTASPSTKQPASRAGTHRYYIVSSTYREDATVFEPTGMVAAQIESPETVLVKELDLSHALLGWSAGLNDGKALTEKYGDRVGYHYDRREDIGLFWSNDPQTSIGTMIKSLGLEEIDAQIARNGRLQDAARGGPPR